MNTGAAPRSVTCGMQYAPRSVAFEMRYAPRNVACEMRYAQRNVACEMRYASRTERSTCGNAHETRRICRTARRAGYLAERKKGKL